MFWAILSLISLLKGHMWTIRRTPIWAGLSGPIQQVLKPSPTFRRRISIVGTRLTTSMMRCRACKDHICGVDDAVIRALPTLLFESAESPRLHNQFKSSKTRRLLASLVPASGTEIQESASVARADMQKPPSGEFDPGSQDCQWPNFLPRLPGKQARVLSRSFV